jgi:cytochrome o ubiquinol oxidase operon protein cyoD
MIDSHHGWNTSIKPVITGFVLSLLCTVAAYLIVIGNLYRPWIYLVMVAGLGFVQTVFHMLFFFHLGQEKKPRWNLVMFLFMVLVVVIIVGGSLWIMNNLNEYMMPA